MKKNIIKHAIMTEKTMGFTERENKLAFVVDIKANKNDVREAVQTLYKVKVVNVDTVITPKGIKRAIVQLAPENSAEEIATNMGVV